MGKADTNRIIIDICAETTYHNPYEVIPCYCSMELKN